MAGKDGGSVTDEVDASSLDGTLTGSGDPEGCDCTLPGKRQVPGQGIAVLVALFGLALLRRQSRRQ
jgi:MYXO-CTERM domain-containing protein